MPDLDVRSYLKGKGLEPRLSGKEICVPCFFECGEAGNSKKKKLYISAEHGAFDCKVCGHQGGWKAILEHFGDAIEGTPFEKPSRKLAIYEEYTRLAQDALMANQKALTYLEGRGFTVETIERARLGYVPKGISLIESIPSALQAGGFTRDELRASGLLRPSGGDFHSGRILIPYMTGGQVIQIRGRALDPNLEPRYQTPAGDPVRLYNSDSLRGAERALICEGELDAIALQQVLRASPDPAARNLAVVAIPGAGILPGGKDEFGQWFEDVRRVYVGLDNDPVGKQNAVKIKDLLTTKARIVELADVKDWSDWVHDGGTWQAAMELLAVADMLGKRVFSITEAVISAEKQRNAAPGFKTGLASLDALVAPGFMPGQVIVHAATTGTGKSVALANIVDRNRDKPILLVTLEMTKEETANRLLRIARFMNPTIEARALGQVYPNLGVVDENRVRPEDLINLIEEFNEEHGERPEALMVDYLGYYARGVRGKDNYERVTEAIMGLKAVSKEIHAPVFVPTQVSRVQEPGEPISLQAMRDAGPVEETADFIIGLYAPHRAKSLVKVSQGAISSEMKANLPKSRHGNQDRVVSLRFAPHSLAIVDDSDDAGRFRAEAEVDSYNRGESYKDWLNRRRQADYQSRQGRLPYKDGEN